MSNRIGVRKGQKYVYRLEILQVFKPQTYEERMAKAERVRLDEPMLVEIGWYDSPGSARNYGSYRTDRREWYNNIGKPKTEFVKVVPPDAKDRWDYTWEVRDIPQPVEPDMDYRVYRVPVSLDLGEAVLLPALKRLYEVEE